jgi:hypothetical protein
MSIAGQITQFFRPWGPLGGFSALCLVAAAALHWGPAAQWAAAAHAADEAVAALDRPARRSQANRPAGMAAASAELPTLQHQSERLTALLGLATQSGLQVSDTALSHDAVGPPDTRRLRIVQPVKGRYADLRKFMEAALAADSALSLDQVRLSRSEVDSADLGAEIVWSLHSRVDGTGRP